jgi:CheY-like chemotaxis protein
MWRSRSTEQPPSIEEIRKKARILVVDDEPFPYQELFSRDGYHLDKWSQIESLSQLNDNHFDLILLDLNGIAAADAPTMQGLAVLEHIKHESPSQLVIAYSGQDWGVNAQEFLSLADDVLKKSEDYIVFKGKVDELLLKRFSIGFFLEAINKTVGDQVDRVPKLIPKSVKAIRSGNRTALQRYLAEHLREQVTIDRVLGLAGIATSVLLR